MSDPITRIDFYLEHPSQIIPFSEGQLKHWIVQVCLHFNKELGQINYILSTDEAVYQINLQHLNHDFYTDIITFQLDDEMVEGDIFISLDQIEQNALELKVSFESEFLRVLIHGILHMIGFSDKTEAQSSEMRKAEDECIKLFYALESQI